MRLAAVALLLIGCQEDPKDFPLVPGGGGGVVGPPPSGVVDAPTSDANLQVGRVCSLLDPRDQFGCEEANVENITVTIGVATTLTDVDGAFVIDLPQGTGLVWRVSHPDFVESVQQLGATYHLPALRKLAYEDLLSTNGLILTPGQSSVFVQVLTAGAPLKGATVTSDASLLPPRYDGNSAVFWDQDATDDFGVAWIPGTTGTTAQLTVTSGATSVTTTVPLLPDGITFATVEL